MLRFSFGRMRPSHLLALLAFVACADQPVQPVQPVTEWDPAARVVGRWQWVSSQHSQTGAVVTPLAAGFQAELILVRESPRSGTFRFSRTDGAIVEGRFDIVSEDSPGNDFIVLSSGIAYLSRAAWVTAGPDSRRLGGVYESGYNSKYARLR